MKITIAKLDEWGACNRADGERYSDAKLKKLFRGRESLTLLDVLRMRSVPIEDKVWVATQPGVLTAARRTRWLEAIVTRVVRTHALHCGLPDVEAWARRWLSGEDRSVRSAETAWEAAWAVRSIAAQSAWSAAWSAVATQSSWEAARFIAAQSAWSAAWSAVATEATDGAEAERKRQVRDLWKVVK